MLLFKRHTTAGNRKLFLDLVFTFLTSAPHSLYESGLFVEDLLKFFHVVSHIGMAVTVCSCSLQHILLHGLENLCSLGLQIFQCYLDLLSGVTAADHALAGLDIFRADLHTDRVTSHLSLCELEAGSLVAVIYFYAEALSQAVSQFISLVQNAFLFLHNRYDADLDRSHTGRNYQTFVVTVYHDQCTDQTGRHTPGSLIYML